MRLGGRAAAVAIVMGGLLSGCGPDQARPVTYRMDGRTFASPEAALAEARRKDDGFLAQVIPTTQRLGGSVVIILPSIASIRATLLNATPLKGDAAETIARADDIHVLTDGMAIEKGHIFDSVSILRSDDPAHADGGDADYKIWLDRFGASPIQWTLVTRAGGSHVITPAAATVTRPVWMNSLNIGVLNAAADLGAPVSHQPLPASPATGSIIGTTFFIDQAGHALTNAHVVNGCKSIQVALGGGDEAEAKIVAADTQNDLALLTISSATPSYARFASAPPRQGDPVVVYGFPLAGALSTQGNLATGIVSALVGVKDDSRMLQISAPVQAGNSGGPLFDASGNVVGVVSGKMNALRVAAVTGDLPQNVNFAIKTSVVETFLQTNGMRFEQGGVGKTQAVADIADRAKTFTYKLTCNR
ncbi:S1C family serine protease [Telmatospirillum siberiense]|uniref:Serine protease n=1 Tax=Telmatospirillum siberiense TaxID=382514 RepID=A0A2N3PWA2_9PROT|nr:serine protease [Telmatospirillum siberiense]PKU24693.1 hypothetical protein CWS72_10165 [Telmatospirillum siberiense]